MRLAGEYGCLFADVGVVVVVLVVVVVGVGVVVETVVEGPSLAKGGSPDPGDQPNDTNFLYLRS